MKDMSLEGIGVINGGEFGTLKVEGVGKCNNDIKARSIEVEGVFNCTGSVEAEYLYCGGTANFSSNIRSKKIVIEGMFSNKGGKIEADEIICEGMLKTRGEISADIIKAEGCITANEIVGDQVLIESHQHGFLNLFNRYKSEVKLIEATTIKLSGVTADHVNGRDITIGPNCSIDNVDCSGVLSIDGSSTVKNMTGNYTFRG